MELFKTQKQIMLQAFAQEYRTNWRFDNVHVL